MIHLIDCDSASSTPLQEEGGESKQVDGNSISEESRVSLLRTYSNNNSKAGAHVLSMLSRGPEGAQALCRQITRVMRYEYTTSGIRLVVHGAEVSYEVVRSDVEELLDREELDRAAVRIQSMARGGQGRQRCREIQNDHERWKSIQRNLSATMVR